MPKKAKEFSALDIKRANHPGSPERNIFMAVGGVSGLLLQITQNNSKSWLLRTTIGKRRRALGLGGYPDVGLSAAREAAREAKALIAQGIDPIERKKEARAALSATQKRGMIFDDAVEKYLDAKLDEFGNEKHKKQWRSTLDNYAGPAIGDMHVAEIEVHDVLRALEPIWTSKTETATRLRGRIESVLSWATVAGHRSGDNPARWKGNLDAILPKPSKVAKVERWPALAISDTARWWKDLGQRQGMAAMALRFQALTAARSGAVRLATWDEIDFENRLWTIQPGRKASKIAPSGNSHRVPLTDEIIRLLRLVPREMDQQLIFWAPKGGPLSDMSISAVMKRIHEASVKEGADGFVDQSSKRPAVPHGLRSTFRDWAAENGWERDLAEISLAHTVGSNVERAYRRTDLIDRRRELLAAWGRFLSGEQGETIVTLQPGRSA